MESSNKIVVKVDSDDDSLSNSKSKQSISISHKYGFTKSKKQKSHTNNNKKKTYSRKRVKIAEESDSIQEHKKEFYEGEAKIRKTIESATAFNSYINSMRFQHGKHFLKRKIKHTYEREENLPQFFMVGRPFPKQEMFSQFQELFHYQQQQSRQGQAININASQIPRGNVVSGTNVSMRVSQQSNYQHAGSNPMNNRNILPQGMRNQMMLSTNTNTAPNMQVRHIQSIPQVNPIQQQQQYQMTSANVAAQQGKPPNKKFQINTVAQNTTNVVNATMGNSQLTGNGGSNKTFNATQIQHQAQGQQPHVAVNTQQQNEIRVRISSDDKREKKEKMLQLYKKNPEELRNKLGQRDYETLEDYFLKNGDIQCKAQLPLLNNTIIKQIPNVMTGHGNLSQQNVNK